MNLITEGGGAIEFFSDSESLISGELKRFSVYRQNERLLLDLDITLLYSKKFKDVTLRFIDVLEYSFYYKNHNSFYYIEDYKFFVTAEQAYISLDPVDGSGNEIDPNDNDFVIAKELKVYV
ncbi:MAG: hypothetical protein ABIN80_07830 [Dyadobacter sp.]|uniref:hypothetical protein n=1 Tax=Dyadobacter sp. TaxID=1914288 RepID=UPI003266A2D5